jgi:hypothetical protein
MTSIFQEGVEYIERVLGGAEKEAAALLAKFDETELPIIKTFLETLGSQVGKAAIKAAIGAAPLMASGGFAAAAAVVGAAVVATATADAPVDAQVALQATQAALQVVKVANTIITSGDASTVAAITAAQPTA